MWNKPYFIDRERRVLFRNWKFSLSYGSKEVSDNDSPFQLSMRSLMKDNTLADTNMHSNDLQTFPTMTSGSIVINCLFILLLLRFLRWSNQCTVHIRNKFWYVWIQATEYLSPSQWVLWYKWIFDMFHSEHNRLWQFFGSESIWCSKGWFKVNNEQFLFT